MPRRYHEIHCTFTIVDALIYAVGLAIAAVVCAALSLPFVLLGVRARRRDRARARWPWALGAALGCGFVAAVAGFLWGASIPDESAGAIAVALFTIGGAVGLATGAVVAFALITRFTR
jgi:hypothetical protein